METLCNYKDRHLVERRTKSFYFCLVADNNSGLDALATLAASSLSGFDLDKSLNVFADAAAALEDSREETESIPEKQASPKHRDAMGETNNQQANVKLELENGNVQGEGREKDDKKDTGSAAVLVVDRQPSTSPESQKRKRKTYVPKANLATDEDAGVVLKPRSRLKRTPGTKALSSKPGPKPIKKQSETAAEDGDLTSQGKEPIVEEEEDQAMEIDESSPPLKLWSKKKGVPEKFAVERVSTTVLGRASPHDELLQKQPPHCAHTTPDLGPASATVGNPCLYIASTCQIESSTRWLSNWRNSWIIHGK
jgi:hypothetical protein